MALYLLVPWLLVLPWSIVFHISLVILVLAITSSRFTSYLRRPSVRRVRHYAHVVRVFVLP
jgi:hypothetical protein